MYNLKNIESSHGRELLLVAGLQSVSYQWFSLDLRPKRVSDFVIYYESQREEKENSWFQDRLFSFKFLKLLKIFEKDFSITFKKYFYMGINYFEIKLLFYLIFDKL